jgi:hypothetical protein
VLKRRGLAMGSVAEALYYSTGILGNNGPDVDAPPAQIPFIAQNMRTGGTLKFDDATLQDCPPEPTRTPEQERWMLLREQAWELGIDPDGVGK